MNQNLWHHLSLISELHAVYAEDLSDQLMSKYTSLGLLAVASVLAVKQYIFKPIQCWVPAEWPRPWEEYTESYCWIQNTYHVAYMAPGHPDLHAREENEIGYFQWVPILLPLQALLVLLPHTVWRVVAGQSACDPNALVRLAMQMEDTKQSTKRRQKLLTYASGQLCKAIGVTRSLNYCGPCSSCNLFIAYIVSKVLHLLMGLGHLYLMKSYLGFDHLSFGWSCAADLLAGRQWQQTRIFPRVTFCDVPVKHVGQWNVRSVQCVLPSNMLYEKVFIFLWFWIVFCMFLMVTFTLNWILSLAIPGQRASTVRRLSRIVWPRARIGRTKEVQPDTSLLIRFLKLDGAFVLKMVALRCGELSAAQILDGVAQLYDRSSCGGSPVHPDRTSTLPLKSRGSHGINGGGVS